MTNTTIKLTVGIVPGLTKDVLVNAGTAVSEVLALAGFDSENKDIRLDGRNVNIEDTVKSDSKLLVLSEKVKGNSAIQLTVGVVPGLTKTILIEDNTTIAEALEIAEFDSENKDIRLDGTNVNVDDIIPSNAKLLVLSEKVKGNVDFTLTVGIVPGLTKEVVLTEPITVAEVLEIAGFDADNKDIRLDGQNVELEDYVKSTSKLLVLSEKVKGNK